MAPGRGAVRGSTGGRKSDEEAGCSHEEDEVLHQADPAEEIIADKNQHFRVAFDKEDESPFVGLLMVEAA